MVPIHWMRKLDTWLGLPLVFFLRLFSKRSACLRGAPIPLPKKIVCCKLLGLGSTILSLPLLHSLKEAGVEVTFLSFPDSAELLSLSGMVREAWPVRATRWRDLLFLIPRLRRLRAECFLDLEPTSNFTAALALLSGCRVRLGFLAGKPSRERLFTHAVSYSSGRHLAENYFLFAKRLGIPTPAVSVLPAAPSFIDAGIKKEDGPAVLVNVNSSDLSQQRLWPAEKWVDLCASILTKFPRPQIYFPGLVKERPRVAPVVSALRARSPESLSRVHDLSGKTNLMQLLALIQQSSLVISVDSSIMHLASWCGVPVVGLFGPESPRLASPLGKNAVSISAELPCSPCLKAVTHKLSRCTDNQCMKEIHPQTVFSRCEHYLASGSRAHESIAP